MNIQQISEEIESLEVYRKFVDVTRSIAQVKELRINDLIDRRKAYWSALQDAAYDTFEAFRNSGLSDADATMSKRRCDPDGRWEERCTSASAPRALRAAGALTYADVQRCIAPSASPSNAGKRSVLLIVAGSNQGLCGDFHRKLMTGLQEKTADTEEHAQGIVLCLGRRTRNSIARMRVPSLTLISRPVPEAGFADELSGLDTYTEVEPRHRSKQTAEGSRQALETAERVRLLAKSVLEAFLKGRFACAGIAEGGLPVDEVRLLYIQAGDREPARTAAPTIDRLLPLDNTLLNGMPKDPLRRRLLGEPSLSLSAAVLLPAYVESCLEHALMHSSRAEHAIRRQETTEASHSLEEMIDQKTMEKRKARRERITKQLVELISAAEAYEQG